MKRRELLRGAGLAAVATGLAACGAQPLAFTLALSLPLFILYGRTGIIDTHFGMIHVYVALNVPFTIWLIDGFFRQVPKELAEAAEIDGCTRWQAFWKVEFPLAKSGLASAAIFAFLTSWNEYALASQLTRTTASKTMPVGLMDFTAQFTVDWTGMSAMAVLIIVPALVLTFIVQKHLIAGLTFGAHFTDGYILGLIGIAFTLLSPQMQLDAFWQGLIGASALMGLFLHQQQLPLLSWLGMALIIGSGILAARR